MQQIQMTIFSLLMVLPVLVQAQDRQRSYIALEAGMAQPLNQFTANDGFYDGDLSMGASIGINGVYFINKFGVAAAYNQLNHGPGMPQDVNYEGTQYQGNEEEGSQWGLRGFLIGAQYRKMACRRQTAYW